MFAYFLQPVATKGQHDQVEGNTAVEKFSSWSCAEGAFIQKKRRGPQRKRTRILS